MSLATMSPASAAATTPVSRVHARNTISWRVQRPRRSGTRQTSTVSGRATRIRTATTTSAGPRLSQIVAPRQVRAERDEDEDHHDVGDRGDERAHVALVLRVHPEPEAIHVADDQPGEERAEVAASPRGVDREVANRDDGDDGDRGRLLPDAGSPVGDDEREHDPEDDPEHRRDAEVLRGSRGRARRARRRRSRRRRRARARARPRSRRSAPTRRSTVCSIFWRMPMRVEERDQDRRIGGREHGADQEPRREREVEGERRDVPVTSAVMTTPGTASRPSPTATRLRTPIESWSPP